MRHAITYAVPMCRHLAALLLSVAWTPSLFAQVEYPDAPSVLDAYIESNGGMEKLRRIYSIRAVGIVETPTDRFKSIYLRKRPNMWYLSRKQQGRTIIMASDGDTAWRMLSDGSRYQVEALTPDNPIVRQQNSVDIEGELVNYAKPGRSVELLGIEGTGADREYKIRMQYEAGGESIWYLNVRTLRESRKVITTQVQGQPQVSVETYEDFVEVNQYWVPTRITQTINGEPFSTTQFDVIELNAGIFSEQFAMPDVPPSPAQDAS